MKTAGQIRCLGLIAIAFSFGSLRLEAGTPPDHSWNPSRTVNPPYGLIDLDPSLESTDYGYCHWGVRMSDMEPGVNGFSVTKLTDNWSELFFLDDLASTHPTEYPIWGQFANWSLDGLSFLLPSANLPSASPVLMRQYHFESFLQDEKGVIGPYPLVGANTKKAVVLIHGWNPESDNDDYDDPGNNKEFYSLKTNMRSALSADGGSDWALVTYHWEKDADTGFNISVAAGVHGSEAAEAGHRHGQHLGELIDELTNHGIEKIHFIVHSAGTWVARSATRYLLKSRADNPGRRPIKIQITFLDPFIPADLGIKDGIGSSNLARSDISGIPQFYGATSDSLYRLDNYYSGDILTGAATKGDFSWRSAYWDLNGLEVGENGIDSNDPFGSHSGPIQYYTATIIASCSAISPSSRAAAISQLATQQLNDMVSLNAFGWQTSMFFNEPVISKHPQTPTPALATGKSALFTALAVLRGNGKPNSEIEYLWETSMDGTHWTTAQDWAISLSGESSYSIPYVNAVLNGLHVRAQVRTRAGYNTTNEAILSVATSDGTTPITGAPSAPSNLSASPISASSISLAWRDNSSNETAFRVQRRLASGSTWTTLPDKPANSTSFTDTGLVAGTAYVYKIEAVGGSLVSGYTPEVTVSTLSPVSAGYVLNLGSLNPSSGVSISSFVGTGQFLSGLTPDKSRTFTLGTNVTVTCPASLVTGQIFQKWQMDGSDYGFNEVATVTMNAGHTLTAVYDQSPAPTRLLTSLSIGGPSSVNESSSAMYTATASFSDGSSQAVTPAWSITSGAPATISSAGTLDTGVVANDMPMTVFASYTSGGVTIPTARNVTIANVTTAKACKLTLSVNDSSQGNISPSSIGDGTYAAGSIARLTASPNYGYHLVSWGGDASGSAGYVDVIMNGDKTVTATFAAGDPRIGTLEVTILPPAAAAAGVRWGFNANDYRASGSSYSTFPGTYEMVLHTVDGWLGPFAQFMTVTAGKTTNVTVTFTQDPTPGTLSVTLTPPSAVTAGAKWHVNGGSALNSGASASLAPGNYTVTFDAASGWAAPPSQVVSVARAQTAVITGNYTPPGGAPEISSVVPSVGQLAGGTLMTIQGFNFASPATVTIGGKPATNVTVVSTSQITCTTPSSAIYGTAPVVVKTAGGSAANANGFAYGVPRGSGIGLVGSIGGTVNAVTAQGNYCYAGEGSTLVILDVTNPTTPSPVSRLALPGKIQNLTLFSSAAKQYAAVADDDAGLQVVDVTDPAAPALRGYYNTGDEAFDVAVLGEYAYVANGGSGVMVLSIADPVHPQLAGSLSTTGSCDRLVVQTSGASILAYVSAGGGLAIVNATAASHPVLLGQSNSVTFSWERHSLAVSGSRAFLTDSYGYLQAIDVSNPASPASLGSVSSDVPSAVTISNGDVFTWGGTLSAYSLAGGALHSLGTLSSGLPFAGSSMAILGGTAICAAGENGLFFYNVGTPASLKFQGKYASTAGYYLSVDASGSTAFASTQNDGLKVINISNPASPTLTSQFASGGSKVVVSGTRAYVLDGGGQIHMLDVSSATQPPVSLGVTSQSTFIAFDFYLVGNSIIAAGFDTTQGPYKPATAVFDASNPASLVLHHPLDFTTQNGGAGSIAGNSGIACVAVPLATGNHSSLSVIDISNPADLQQVGQIPDVGYVNVRCMRLSEDGRYLYIGCFDSNWEVVDLANHASPAIVGLTTVNSAVNGLELDGTNLYVAEGKNILVYDVSVPAQPRFLASYNTPGSAMGVKVSGNALYVPASDAGLNILNLIDISPPQILITSPPSSALFNTSLTTLNLSGTAFDDQGLAQGTTTSVTWSNNRGGGGVAAGTTAWSVTGIPLASGTNIITVSAVDNVGNSSTGSLTVIYTPPDTTPPAVNITSPTSTKSKTTSSNTVDLGGLAADNAGVTSVQWSNDRGGSGMASGTANWTAAGIPLLPGSNRITLTARDAAGNTGTDYIAVFYTLPDSSPPTVTISFPTLDPTLTTTSGTLSLGGVATDDQGIASVHWTNDRGGQGTAAGGSNWSAGGIVLQAGLNVITVTALDAAGNAATDSIIVNYTAVTNALRPVVKITEPALSAQIENTTISVTGTATGSKGVSAVLYQLNDGPWLPAQGTTSWTASVEPPPGLNTLRAKSLDSVRAESLVVTRTFTRVLRADLALSTSGNGTVIHTGFVSTTGLEVGKNYVLSAVPKSGSIFAGYSGSIISGLPAITFTMQPGMAVVANFTTSPFPAVAGTYLGLVQTDPQTQASSGLLRVVSTSTGAFTGTLSLGGGAYALSGKFSSTGQWVGQIIRSKKTPLTALLMLDVTNGTDSITGLVSDGIFTSSINSYRSTFNSRTHVCPQIGRYTIVVDPEAGNTAAPAGFGYATFTVDGSGNTVMAGKLGDGTALSGSAFMTKQGTWPLYSALYSGTGCVSGELTFTAFADSDASGGLYWFKPQRLADLYFKPGFETAPRLAAQSYVAPALHHRALPGWDATGGAATATIAGAGLSSLSLVQPIGLTVDNKVTSDATVVKSLVFNMASLTGTFSGSFLHPDTKKTTPFSGVLLQKTSEGAGVVTGSSTVGSVLLALPH